jgi:hypothetical protein
VFRPPFSIFYEGDKPALAAGPDPVVTGRDNLYTTWDDFSFNTVNGKFFTGLPVASSTDGGATWHLAYAKRFNLTNVRGCSFKQFLGATPIVNPADGTLYVVAERLAVNDPKCVGAPLQRSEWIFRSTNGGKTFGPGVRIAGVIEAVPSDLLFLGPGKYMRNMELPAIALRGKAIDVAWDDGGLGRSHTGSPPRPMAGGPGGRRSSPPARSMRCSQPCRPMAVAFTSSTTSATPTTPSTCSSATPGPAPGSPPNA